MAQSGIPFTFDRSGAPLNTPEEAPGFLRQVWANASLNTTTQLIGGLSAWAIGQMTEEEGYDPYGDIKGYEPYVDTLGWARSPQHMQVLKDHIDINLKEQEAASAGGYWLLPNLVGGLVEPLNLIPIPAARGFGFVRGALRGAAGNVALAAATEPLRIMADPVAEWDEYGTSLGVSAIFGGILGAGAGVFSAPTMSRASRAARAVFDHLSEADGLSFARPFDAAEERYTVQTGRTPSRRIVEISTRDVPEREAAASDGQLYHYDDTFGWILKSEIGKADPSPVDAAIIDELGVPARKTENVMTVDEVRARVDFDAGLAPEGIRTPNEYVTYKQIEAVWEKRLPREAGETDEAFQLRVGESAMRELKASRAPSSVARRGFLAPWLDQVNRSPVAKAIRLFADDAFMTDLPLKIAGDYGWGTRANEFGYKTPPSMLMRAMRYNKVFLDIKSELDSQFVKYAQGNAAAQSKVIYNQNWSATAAGVQARMSGGRLMTRDTFARMAGRAVYDTSDFTVDGFTVVPEARAVAKAWTREALRIEAIARDLGIFYDQAGIERTLRETDAEILKMRKKMLRWMWGGEESPSALEPAIKVGDRIFTGKTHEEAIMRALDDLGDQTVITADMHGYVPRAAASTASPANMAIGEGDLPKPKFTVQTKLIGGAGTPLGYRSFDDYMGYMPEGKHDPLIVDESTFRAAQMKLIRGSMDRSLWDVAKSLHQDGMLIEGQLNLYGFNGLTFRDPAGGPLMFRSAQVHAAMSALPKETLDAVKQVLDQIYPDRVAPNQSVTLYDDITDPDPGDNPAYNITAQQGRDRYKEGYRTVGLHDTGISLSDDGRLFLRSAIFVAINQNSDLAVLNTSYHEAVHGLYRTGRITQAEWDLLKAEARKRDWHTAFTKDENGKIENVLDDEEAIAHAIGYWAQNPDDPRFGGLDQPTKDIIERIIEFFKTLGDRLRGIEREKKISLAQILDDIGSGEMGRRDPRYYKTYSEAQAAQAGYVMQSTATGQRFRKMTDVWQERIDSLSDRQKEYMDGWRRELDAMVAEREAVTQQLDAIKSRPHHEFRDQDGNVEPYFARYFNHTAIGSERARFERLVVSWYARDNPVGADQRAAETVDNMLGLGDAADVRPSTRPGLRHLHERTLNIPNSYKVVDPELGEIAMSEFINTNLEAVAESYVRGMGHKIEAARMFGDAGLLKSERQLREHFRENYIAKAHEEGLPTEGLEERYKEYLGWLTLTRQSVLGGLRDHAAWQMTNDTARALKNAAALSSMGGAVVNSLSEIGRIPMVNGFRLMFPTLFARLLTDARKLKENLELNRETMEIADLAMDMHGARMAEGNDADPSGGGSYIGRLLERVMPGFYKLTGLTHWTVMAKDMIMLGAQHKIMDYAQNYGAGNNAFRLAALGISERDAVLLASMPVERKGSLILPAVQSWTGADGMRARTLLLDAIHAEARRAIVTPSEADKSILFRGVVAVKGQKVSESDVYSMPLQFMSYGIAANQKIVMSGLQGRDQSGISGALAMLMLGTLSAYLTTSDSAIENKSLPELMVDGYDRSGIGGFVFGDLNNLIERYSNNQLGLRPMLGMEPRFGKETGIGSYSDIGGPAIGKIYDITLDQYLNEDLSPSNRAQAFRRAIPLNNVWWFADLPRWLASGAAQPFE